mmetsp:Transcript_38388/g.95094  ORF Transcript_38388/g.95094 Transcript_38388/m.95094 type:complete len:218 (-) Transcript_38388:880-1533(-)
MRPRLRHRFPPTAHRQPQHPPESRAAPAASSSQTPGHHGPPDCSRASFSRTPTLPGLLPPDHGELSVSPGGPIPDRSGSPSPGELSVSAGGPRARQHPRAQCPLPQCPQLWTFLKGVCAHAVESPATGAAQPPCPQPSCPQPQCPQTQRPQPQSPQPRCPQPQCPQPWCPQLARSRACLPLAVCAWPGGVFRNRVLCPRCSTWRRANAGRAGRRSVS